MKTEGITTHDIRIGDRIANYGMVLVVDREPRQTSHPENGGGTTLATRAVIENWPALVERAALGDSTAQYITALADKDADGIARWTIQGNGWARWARII